MTESESEHSVEALLELFDVAEVEGGAPGQPGDTRLLRPTTFPETGSLTFVYGGQLLAHALRAAAATVDDDRLPHSLHAYFLKAGRASVPYTITVTSLREGGSFSHRRAEIAHDGDSPFFVATASFTRTRTQGADGRTLAEYQLPMPAGVGNPDGTGPWQRRPATFIKAWSAFDVLEFDIPEPGADGVLPFSRRFWLRFKEGFPSEDPILTAEALAYSSDLGVVIAASQTEGTARHVGLSSTLDHALHLHRPTDLREWHLVDMVSVSNSGGRGTVRVTFHRADGVLVASATQEVFIR